MPSTKKSSAASAALNSKANKPSVPSRSAMPRNASPEPGEKSNGKTHKRSRSGCFTCRLRRKKCDEAHPVCGACVNLSVRCEYKRPVWWGNAEQRRTQKERIKNKIKQTKMLERNNAHDPFRRNQCLPPTTGSPEFDFNRPMYAEPYDMFSSHLPTPGLGVGPYGPYAPPYEIDVKTEWQTFVNDVPMRHDTSTSTFSSFTLPQLNVPLPAFASDECVGEPSQVSTFQSINPGTIDPRIAQPPSLPQSSIPAGFDDQSLLDHFTHKVLPQIFPVLEAHQMSLWATLAIEQALSWNLSYQHCCMSVAAIHYKSTTVGPVGDQIDDKIFDHRYETIKALYHDMETIIENKDCQETLALSQGIVDTTLAMIFLRSSVDPTDDEPLKVRPDGPSSDFPWYRHFQAATGYIEPRFAPFEAATDPDEIVERARKDPEFQASLETFDFNVALTTWIDILGSTMMGTRPRFARTYHIKFRGHTRSALRELMGCDDEIMYLISEIACLDALKHAGSIDDTRVCECIQNIGHQLNLTQPADPTLEEPYYPSTRVIYPEALAKTISHIFRIAARLYLVSLVPAFNRHESSTASVIERLVSAVTFALQWYIPDGPAGFDRSLVWPLFMTGIFSTPDSEFRKLLAERAEELKEKANIGSFGRMYKLLKEVWRLNDGPANTQGSSGDNCISSLTSPISKLEKPELPTHAEFTLGGQVIKPQQVHWRSVMSKNDWHYLLI